MSNGTMELLLALLGKDTQRIFRFDKTHNPISSYVKDREPISYLNLDEPNDDE